MIEGAFRGAVCAAAVLALSSQAWASPSGVIRPDCFVAGFRPFLDVSAPPGQPVRVGDFQGAGRDCSSGGLPSVQVLRPPEVGQVVVEPGSAVTGGRRSCGDRATPTQRVSFVPPSGYRGTVHFQIDLAYPDSHIGKRVVTIDYGECRAARAGVQGVDGTCRRVLSGPDVQSDGYVGTGPYRAGGACS